MNVRVNSMTGCAVLVHAGRLHSHDADVRARFRLARLEHLALRADRVAFEQRMRQAHFVPAEIGDGVHRQVGHRLAGDQREREARVHERLFELGLARVLRVEVNRVGVHRQAREPDVVGLSDRAPERMLVDVADLEVLEHAPGPTLLDCHSLSVSRIFRLRRIPFKSSSPCATWRSCGSRTQLLENASAVLTERRECRPSPPRRRSICTGGRSAVQRAGRRVDLAPAVALCQLRMLQELADRIRRA